MKRLDINGQNWRVLVCKREKLCGKAKKKSKTKNQILRIVYMHSLLLFQDCPSDWDLNSLTEIDLVQLKKL